MAEPLVLIESTGAVRKLTLNRPASLNSFTSAMHRELRAALDAAADDASVRCLVITGAGRAFSAGQDLNDPEVGTNVGQVVERIYKPLALRIASMPIPVIAMVNGVAAGAGANFALGCDLVIAAKSASFIQAFSKIGLIPDCGGTWLLPRLVGWEKACEIAFRGRTLSAQEALELGLVSKLVPAELCLKETLAIAHEIAENAPLAVQATKRMMRLGLDETFSDNVHHVFLQLLPLMRSKDFQEGVKAFLERRPPRFEGK
jgi:2-(1,2-epoxy-1,2-dihydrophenyl)acetyl-CoA isomerase